MGAALLAAGDPAAVDALRQALRLCPGQPSTLGNLGLALKRQECWAEAAAHLRPDWPDALYNLAAVLRPLAQCGRAEALLRRVLTLQPDNVPALVNLSNLLSDTDRLQEALPFSRHAYTLAPQDVLTQLNHALQLLADGQFAAGWDIGRDRWLSRNPRYDLGLPLWDGQRLPEGRVLVWREQGIGDEVMFASLLPELLAAGHRITLLCEPRLKPAFARSMPQLAFHESGDAGSDLRAQVPLCELPRLLRRHEQDFARAPQPYLQADPRRAALLRQRYADGRPLIGLAWHTQNAEASHRSIPLASFAPLLAEARLRFVSLQYGDPARLAAEAAGLPLLVDPEIDGLASAEDALAQVAAMDSIVSIDNSTVHFAGALGVPCQVLLPIRAEWRWLRGRPDMPGYRSLRLVRQTPGEAWDSVAARAAVSLGPCEKNR